MRLIIQIPCFNEEATLPQTIRNLPHHIEGVDCIETLVIDDGSTDRTAEVAHRLHVDHIVHHTTNKGLAAAFQSGLNASLELGADVVVNTDADNQYPGNMIAALIQPILAAQADVVIGDRQTDQLRHFSASKKLFQRIGSGVVRYVSGTDVPDAPCGFRAFSREAALRLNVMTTYTYTLETIIQAGKKNLKIAHIPITANAEQRPSRLMRSSTHYILRSSSTILRLFMLHEPLRTFTYLSLPFFLMGGIFWVRFLVLMVLDEAGRGAHVQSIIVGAASIIIGFLIFLFGLIGDMIAINRRLHEEILYYLKRGTFSKGPEPRHANDAADEQEAAS
jgi:glycosyltransferase involved in cell wall biosynthesis